MALTKIFTGMEKGPETINTNFEAIDKIITPKTYVTTVPNFLNNWSNRGETRVSRVGQIVLLNLDLTLTKAYPSDSFGMFMLPEWACPADLVSGVLFQNNSTSFVKDLMINKSGMGYFGRSGSDVNNYVVGSLTFLAAN